MRQAWVGVWAGVLGAVVLVPGVARGDELDDLKARVRALERENQELRAAARGPAAPAGPAADEHARCGRDDFRSVRDVTVAPPAPGPEGPAPASAAAPTPFLGDPSVARDPLIAKEIFHDAAG